MKVIPALLAMAAIAHGASSDPGKTAVDFLEKVRQGKVDLSPGADTALSPQTSDGKKREIAKRLERIGKDLGSDPLEIGAVKTDENYAAVLIRKVGGFDPSRLQVFPVALVKRGSEWSAAPVPASFENAGAGYALTLRKRLDLLENWMLREQVVDLQNLREQSADRMRSKIQSSLTADDLRSMDQDKMANRFIEACAKKDLPAVLGLLGGLSAELPEDWSSRLKAADRAISGGATPNRSWRLMTSPDVLRLIVHQEIDSDGGLFSVGCLNPVLEGGTSRPRIEIIHFELSKTLEGTWRVDPPEQFYEETAEPEEESADDPDAELLDAFPSKWRATHPATPQADAASLYQAIPTALRSGKLTELLALGDFGTEPAASKVSFLEAARLWWSLNNPATAGQVMQLEFRETGDAAVALYQFFSVKDPEKANFQTLHFRKSTNGWLWTPTPESKTKEELEQLIAPEVKRWKDTWQQKLLAGSMELKEFPANPPPDKEAARKLIENWFAATRAGDFEAALALTARSPGGGTAVLRNLGYDIISARYGEPAATISEIFQGTNWTGVAVNAMQAGKISLPFYPVILTTAGPRIMMEIDLSASRNRDFLNKIALERLQNFAGPEAGEDLRRLFKSFQAKAEMPQK